MRYAKVAISLDEALLKRLDRLVRSQRFESRSQAIQSAISEKLARIDRNRLATESGKLDKKFEQALADEGLSNEIEGWPEY